MYRGRAVNKAKTRCAQPQPEISPSSNLTRVQLAEQGQLHTMQSLVAAQIKSHQAK